MAGRAEWRTLSGDPRSGWGWLVRDAHRWAGLGLRRTSLGLIGLSVYSSVREQIVPATLLMTSALCCGAIVPRTEEGPPVSEPSPGQAFVGTVEVLRGGAWLGEDRVVATFVEGWLHVEGLRTDFALRSEDVEAIEGDGLTLTDGTVLRFKLRLGPRDPSRDDFHVKVDWATFGRRLQRWTIEPIPQGASRLPPDHPHPSARVRVVADLAVATFAVVLGMVVAWSVGIGWGLAAFLLVPGPRLDRAFVAAVQLGRLPEVG